MGRPKELKKQRYIIVTMTGEQLSKDYDDFQEAKKDLQFKHGMEAFGIADCSSEGAVYRQLGVGFGWTTDSWAWSACRRKVK